VPLATIATELLVNEGLQISLATVRRHLNHFGVFGRVAQNKPLIPLINRRRQVYLQSSR
jgi:hypothetical protein